jgi:hypothetical protein
MYLQIVPTNDVGKHVDGDGDGGGEGDGGGDEDGDGHEDDDGDGKDSDGEDGDGEDGDGSEDMKLMRRWLVMEKITQLMSIMIKTTLQLQ